MMCIFSEDLKKLHAMYQTRSSASTMQQIQILIQNSRVIHFCHTPLLFLPRYVNIRVTNETIIYEFTLGGVCSLLLQEIIP